MTNSTMNVVDPESDFVAEDRDRLSQVFKEAQQSGSLDLYALPEAAQSQVVFALQHLAQGEAVATISTSRPLSTTQAARALGMSRTHLKRLCEEGYINSFPVGKHLRIPGEEVLRVLAERGQAMVDSRDAAATADKRRRERAARAAGLI